MRRFLLFASVSLWGYIAPGVYYRPREGSRDDLDLMRLIDEQFTQTPFYGTRRLCVALKEKGYIVN